MHVIVTVIIFVGLDCTDGGENRLRVKGQTVGSARASLAHFTPGSV